MIFISHTHSDKAIVEPIALELSKRYGKNKIFYDSWSIKPGESIIGTIEKGLCECLFFIIFVSRNSLNSQMVNLEWKSGLTKKMQQGTKFIPVILDNTNNSDIPSVLQDIRHINLYKYGEQAITELVDTISNNKNSMLSEEKIVKTHLIVPIYKQSEVPINPPAGSMWIRVPD